MLELNRRHLLGGAVAASAATALSPLAASPVHAAAPPVGKQAPGWYRHKVGSIEVTVVTDGLRTSAVPDTFVRNQPKEAVHAALASLYMDKDRALAPFNPVVVNTGSKLVVIDTGFGPAMLEQSKGALGQFQGNLAAAGIDRNTVDTVVISHFHGDHINGLLAADNKAAYPNAEVMVPDPEWKFWMSDDNMNKAPEAMKGAFNNVRRVFGIIGNKRTNYEPGKDVAPGIASVAAHGHSPGHTIHIVNSGNSSLMIQGDTTILPQLFVRNPGWHVMFDMDAPAAEATRRRIYDRLVADKMLVQGYHYPFPALAYIEKSATGYREIPVSWNPTI